MQAELDSQCGRKLVPTSAAHTHTPRVRKVVPFYFRAKRTCECVRARHRTTTLDRGMEDEWRDRHNMRLEHCVLALPDGVATQPVCYLAGRCVCKGDGFPLLRRRDASKLEVDDVCKHGTEFGVALLQGDIAIKLEACKLRDESDRGHTVVGWLHVGAHYVVPYVSTPQRLRRIGTLDEAPPPMIGEYMSRCRTNAAE